MAKVGLQGIYLVEVHIHALKLKVGGAMVAADYQRRLLIDNMM
jgi:hypothetical protein